MTPERLAELRALAQPHPLLGLKGIVPVRAQDLSDLIDTAAEVDRLRAQVEAVDRLCRTRDDDALIWVRDVAEALADRG